MSAYEHQRWAELQEHWRKKANRRHVLPRKATAALGDTAGKAKDKMASAGRRVADAAPGPVKNAAEATLDSALAPTVESIIKLLELLNDWIVELTDADKVLQHHRARGRDVSSLDDLRGLDLEELDEVTRRLVLQWRTFGAGQGAALGALAMIPVPVLGSVAAISLDMVAMQALSAAIATHVCYAYGINPNDPAMRPVVDRMAARSYGRQMPKAAAVNHAGSAFTATKGRVRWSPKLREDQRLMAAIEKLLKRSGGGGHVPVKNARMGLPLIAVFVGAGTNSHQLGDIALQARQYGATLHLAQKYGLDLPASLLHMHESSDEPVDESPEGP